MVPLFAKQAVRPSATVIGAPPERTIVPAASTISQETSACQVPPSTVTTYSLTSHEISFEWAPIPVQSSCSKTIHSESSAFVPAEVNQSPRLPEIAPGFLWRVWFAVALDSPATSKPLPGSSSLPSPSTPSPSPSSVPMISIITDGSAAIARARTSSPLNDAI